MFEIGDLGVRDGDFVRLDSRHCDVRYRVKSSGFWCRAKFGFFGTVLLRKLEIILYTKSSKYLKRNCFYSTKCVLLFGSRNFQHPRLHLSLDLAS